MLFGSAGSCGLIFSVLLLLFLGSRFHSHSDFSTDTISEMMGYAEFFLFAFGSYFSAAVMIWRLRNYFSKFVVSWLPIALFGSIVFSVSFLLMVWVSSVITYQENNPFQSPPPRFGNLILVMLLFGFASFIVTFVSCELVSAIFSFEKRDDGLLI
jgi:hypothetical protein